MIYVNDEFQPTYTANDLAKLHFISHILQFFFTINSQKCFKSTSTATRNHDAVKTAR